MCDPLTVDQRWSGRGGLIGMTFHPDQADPKFKHIHITFRACVQLQLDVDRIDSIIDTQILKTNHNMLVYLAALYYGRNRAIGRNQERKGGHIFRVLHRDLQGKIPGIYKWSTIWNGKNSPKWYIYRRNNSHSTAKWGLYIPENVLWQRDSGYGQ